MCGAPGSVVGFVMWFGTWQDLWWGFFSGLRRRSSWLDHDAPVQIYLQFTAGSKSFYELNDFVYENLPLTKGSLPSNSELVCEVLVALKLMIQRIIANSRLLLCAHERFIPKAYLRDISRPFRQGTDAVAGNKTGSRFLRGRHLNRDLIGLGFLVVCNAVGA